MKIWFSLGKIMKLEVPYVFSVLARAKRTRSHGNFFVKKMGEFDIPELSSEKAPIVVDNVHNGHVRHHNGVFYFPEVLDEKIASIKEWRERLSTGLYTKMNTVGTEFLYKGITNPSCAEEFSHDQFRDIQVNDHDEALAASKKAYEETFVIIGNNIYSRVAEPIFNIRKSPFKNVFRFDVTFGLKDELKNSLHGEYFRINRWSDMVAQIDKHFPGISLIGTKPDVLIDGIYDFKDEYASLKHSAATIVRNTEKDISTAKLDDAIQWFQLRDAMTTASEDISEKTMETLCDKIRDFSHFIDTLVNSTSRAEINSTSRAEMLRKTSEMCISRWENRPIEFGSIFSF